MIRSRSIPLVNVICTLLLCVLQGNVSVLLQPGQELDREQNNRILALVLARDNPDGPRSNQNQAAAMVRTPVHSNLLCNLTLTHSTLITQ